MNDLWKETYDRLITWERQRILARMQGASSALGPRPEMTEDQRIAVWQAIDEAFQREAPMRARWKVRAEE